ncbi:MAG: hypothetical protein R3C05_29740 [Pirellulaceae bacterium]
MQMNLNRMSPLPMLLGICISLPAAAQERNRTQDQTDRNDRQTQDRNEGGESESRSQLRLDPLGQVVIGIDSDGDQRFETVEKISYYDLQNARKQSRQRMSRETSQQQQTSNQQSFDQRQSDGRQMKQGTDNADVKKFSGTVTEVATFRLVDGPEHNFIKIKTKEGKRIPVDLGRIEDLKQLDLKDGDQITVFGKRVRVNDRKMICARRIEASGKTLDTGRERDRDLKRVQGEISKLMRKRFRSRDGEFTIAQVELNGGRTETVILGPTDRLRNLNLEKGDDVQLLVRSGRYNDQFALIADQVRAHGEIARVARPEGTKFTARQRSDSRN